MFCYCLLVSIKFCHPFLKAHSTLFKHPTPNSKNVFDSFRTNVCFSKNIVNVLLLEKYIKMCILHFNLSTTTKIGVICHVYFSIKMMLLRNYFYKTWNRPQLIPTAMCSEPWIIFDYKRLQNLVIKIFTLIVLWQFYSLNPNLRLVSLYVAI